MASSLGEQEHSEGIRGVVVAQLLIYSDEATITRMLGYFRTLLEGLLLSTS